MTGPAVSVVVATRDRAAYLERLLGSLREQTLAEERFEVIVVDDASSDGTQQLLKRARARGDARIRVLRRDSRGGPARARNEGWRVAAAPIIAFTDDDCEAAPGWLEALLEASETHPGAGIQGRTAVPPGGRQAVGPFTRVLEVDGLGPYYQTCNIAYPKRLLEGLGGFDEAFPYPGGEDTDLAWRALKAGADFAFAPNAVVYHAVVDYGPVGKLRWALHWAPMFRIFAHHPELRWNLFLGVFWKRTHALLLLALVGVLLSRRLPPMALLALPYMREIRARCLFDDFSLAWAPYLAFYDLLETFAAVGGSVRSGTFVI